MELTLINEPQNIPETHADDNKISANLIAGFITELPIDSPRLLSEKQITTGSKIFVDFLISEDISYALVGGKSGNILALALYFSLLPDQDTDEKIDAVFAKINSDKDIILSDSIYNDWEEGRAGMLFALSFLIVLKPNKDVEKIFSALVQLLIKDARFYKKRVTWLHSDLKHCERSYSDVTTGIYLTLKHLNSLFDNPFLEILTASIKAPGNVKNLECFISVNSRWEKVLRKLTFISDNKSVVKIKDIIVISRQQGFHDVILANFRETFAHTPSFRLETVIPEIAANCQRLNQYEILARLKKSRLQMDKYTFKILMRRLQLRAWLIDQSDIFSRKNRSEPMCYANCMRVYEMDDFHFFNVKLAVNEVNIHYKVLKSNWLYAAQYKKKNSIGCFSVKRFDKSVVLQIDILDGFLPKLLMYLLDKAASINQFKKDFLDQKSLSINDTHLKNRIVLLIRQGILIPQ